MQAHIAIGADAPINNSLNQFSSFAVMLVLKNNRDKGSYETIISSVDLYGYETLSLALSEERELQMFQNKESRKIYGSEKKGSRLKTLYTVMQ
jgi:hypothetical protein